MNSPSKHPGASSDSESDYAPPWAREQIRPIFGHSAPLPVEKPTLNELIGGGAFGDHPSWFRRGLEPDVVPEPPAGLVDFWPIVLRLGIVCGVAAAVAAAVVLIFSGKPPVQESTRAKTPPPSIASTGSTLPSVQSPGVVPAVLDDKSANAADSIPQAQPPAAQTQAPPAEMPAASQPAPQVVATAPATEPLPSVEASPVPAVNPPAPAVSPPAIAPSGETPPPAQAAPNPASTNPASTSPASTSPASTSPASTSPASTSPVSTSPPSQPGASAETGALAPLNRPEISLDNEEIVRLIKRGKDLLNDGDFAAARLLFERAANAGSAEAALALGGTYDPLVIKRLGALAVTPDIAKARKWYQFAADHGSAAASLQLANLAHTH
jgi:hypothetical protein